MKPDELGFLQACFDAQQGKPYNNSAAQIRDVIMGMVSMADKRCHYLLEKWSAKGWYDYGVTVDLGWFTPEGIVAAEEQLRRQRRREVKP